MMSCMGWFSNLFTNEAVSLAITDQGRSGTATPEPYSAVRTKLTSGLVTQQIMIIRDLIVRLPVSSSERYKHTSGGKASYNYYGTERPWPHRADAYTLMTLLSKSLKEIDVERSDMKTLLRVIDLCNVKLPAKFRELEIQVGQNNWTTERKMLTEMETALKDMLAEVVLLPTTRSILNLEEVTNNNPASKSFPVIESYKDNTELYDALVSLKTSWDKAAELPLSAEDDYVIERVGNSYLPDALLLFDRFCRRTGAESSGKALAIVKEQVELIHQQVAFVLEQHEEDSFSLMETHTEFLKMKNSHIGVNENKDSKRLELEDATPETPL